MFANRTGVAAGLALFGALMGLSIVFTLFVQVGLGWSPLKAGLAGIPQAVGMVIGFVVSQPLGGRWGGRRVMHLGETLALAGLAGFVATLRLAGDGIGALDLAPALATLGVGFGMTMAPFFDITLAGVDESEAGSASGVLTSVQQLGGSVGVAALGTLFWHQLATGAASHTQIGAFRSAAAAALVLSIALMALAGGLTGLLPLRAREDAPGH